MTRNAEQAVQKQSLCWRGELKWLKVCYFGGCQSDGQFNYETIYWGAQLKTGVRNNFQSLVSLNKFS